MEFLKIKSCIVKKYKPKNVLNYMRSGRKQVNELLKYKKMILKNNVTLENT